MAGTLRLYLVRHGVTEWNRAMRMQGHSDVPMDEEGIEQARRLAARLSAESASLDAVWSSDLTRAAVTAEAIAEPFGLTVNLSPLLRETMMGEWEGLTRADIEALGHGEHLERFIRDSLAHRPPDSEPIDAVWQRMAEAVRMIRSSHPEGTVIAVGHGGSLRAVVCQAMGAPSSAIRHLWLDNASLSLIEYSGDPCSPLGRVKLLNDTGHLTP